MQLRQQQYAFALLQQNKDKHVEFTTDSEVYRRQTSKLSYLSDEEDETKNNNNNNQTLIEDDQESFVSATSVSIPELLFFN